VIAIPVFPSRVFRHSGIYVRSDGSVKTPADLRGRRVGVPEWSQTAVVYMTGLLTEEYGLRLQDVQWVQAGVNQPGRTETARLQLPEGVALERNAEKNLDAMLRAGEIDAVLSAHPPHSIETGDPAVQRLFPDHAKVERAYYGKTGIFPIMHTIALRREVYDRNKWIAANLMTAFEQAKARSLQRLREYNTARIPIAWLPTYTAEITSLMGEDFWPYGAEPNRKTLEAFLRFAHNQGVCKRLLKLDELFAPETASRFKV
jgi:4,5-dihydroxyphthalate decarboxylase